MSAGWILLFHSWLMDQVQCLSFASQQSWAISNQTPVLKPTWLTWSCERLLWVYQVSPGREGKGRLTFASLQWRSQPAQRRSLDLFASVLLAARPNDKHPVSERNNPTVKPPLRERPIREYLHQQMTELWDLGIWCYYCSSEGTIPLEKGFSCPRTTFGE